LRAESQFRIRKGVFRLERSTCGGRESPSMTVRSGSPTAILQYEGAAYLAHREFINDVHGRAEKLGLMSGKFRQGIFAQAGIVCDRLRGDDAPA
ncbi:MAG: hypothetical protein V1876_03290, partial [Candidatus Peregrinibacteria bacterium]